MYILWTHSNPSEDSRQNCLKPLNNKEGFLLKDLIQNQKFFFTICVTAPAWAVCLTVRISTSAQVSRVSTRLLCGLLRPIRIAFALAAQLITLMVWTVQVWNLEHSAIPRIRAQTRNRITRPLVQFVVFWIYNVCINTDVYRTVRTSGQAQVSRGSIRTLYGLLLH